MPHVICLTRLGINNQRITTQKQLFPLPPKNKHTIRGIYGSILSQLIEDKPKKKCFWLNHYTGRSETPYIHIRPNEIPSIDLVSYLASLSRRLLSLLRMRVRGGVLPKWSKSIIRSSTVGLSGESSWRLLPLQHHQQASQHKER